MFYSNGLRLVLTRRKAPLSSEAKLLVCADEAKCANNAQISQSSLFHCTQDARLLQLHATCGLLIRMLFVTILKYNYSNGGGRDATEDSSATCLNNIEPETNRLIDAHVRAFPSRLGWDIPVLVSLLCQCARRLHDRSCGVIVLAAEQT